MRIFTGNESESHFQGCWRAPAVPEVVMFNGHHNKEFIPHSHEVATIVFVTKGAYLFTLDGASHTVSAGDLVVIGAHQMHAAKPLHADGWEMRTLHVPPRFLTSMVNRMSGSTVGFSSPVVSLDSAAASMFMAMHRYVLTVDESERQRDRIDQFFNWFRKNLDYFDPQEIRHFALDEEVQSAQMLISRAAFDNTPIENIAEELGISPYALIRRFKKQYGLPPHAWRMQLRANEVARLLRTDCQLAEIAAQCGFCDQAHMSRVFRSVYGVTPGQYRLMH